MGFLIGYVLGAITSYLIVSYFVDLKLRVEVLEDSLGFDKDQARKWLTSKNPGIGLKRPSELRFKEFLDYVDEVQQ